MTDKQKKLVEDNHNLIYSFCKIHNLSVKEYYDIIAIGLCKAAMSFDSTISKFSTYSYQVMRNELFMSNRIKTRKSSIPEYMLDYYNKPLDTKKDGKDIEMLDQLYAPDNTEQEAILNISFHNLLVGLNKREKEVMDLLLCGCSQIEISKQLGISRSYVGKLIRGIKKKLASS